MSSGRLCAMRPLQRAFSLLSAESLSEVLDMIGTGRSGQLSARSLYVRLTRTGVRLPPSARSCWKMPANQQGQECPPPYADHCAPTPPPLLSGDGGER
jgi:hypothetical protein